MVAFSGGAPIAPSNSRDAAVDIMTNPNTSVCADSECFRPTGLALDDQERIFMTSDATGEIWVVRRIAASAGTGGTAAGGNGSPSGTGTGSAASTTPTGSGMQLSVGGFFWTGVGMIIAALI